MSIPPPVPLLDPLLEDFEMFRVRHCRVTSLASGMLRMILPGSPGRAAFGSAGVAWRGLGWLEGHTLCDPPRPVNIQSHCGLTAAVYARHHAFSGESNRQKRRSPQLANQDPMAFWSYTRFDDKHAHGKLTALREQLERELRSQLGTPFAIFQDTEGLEWGERWKEKLVTSIGEALFFIPVVTPTYFGSQVCRTELEAFLQREQKLLYEELILPVYWISVDRPGDELAGTLMSRNYVDFRELRFNNVGDPAVERKIAEIASQLIKRFNEFSERQRLIADVKAIIITPKSQDRVARKIRVTGTIESIPKNMTSWLVVEAGGRYHPQALIDTKDWSATAFIGSAGFGANNNVDFPIHVVAATESASASFTQYRQEQQAHGWSGLPAPAGTRVLATATVRRNDQESALAALIGAYDEYRAKP